MRVLVRTDSSHSIGSGHLMRCLTLANELRDCGSEVVFVSREHEGHLIQKLNKESYFVYRLKAPIPAPIKDPDDYTACLGVTAEQDIVETLAALSGHLFDWLIIDHYSLDLYWERRARLIAKQILVIDDLANRHHDCDLLLDQNYFGQQADYRYQNLVPTYCRYMLGPKYALIQADYAQLRKARAPHKGQIHQVLVFFGGSDISRQTHKLLVSLNSPNLLHLNVDVVIGANYPDPQEIKILVDKRPKTLLYQDISTLAPLIASADLMIGAGGSTTWERMCLCVPSLAISVADNQQFVLNALVKDGYQMTITHGKYATTNEWILAICQLEKEHTIVKKLSIRSGELVDGLGAKRVAQVILWGNSDE